MKPSAARTTRAALGRAAAVAATIMAAIGRVARASATGLWRHRSALCSVVTRAAWWAALAAWWTVAVGLVGGGVLDVDRGLTVFAAGALVCAMVVVLGSASRLSQLRWLGGVLGSVHGTSALVLWLVVNA